MNFGLSKRTVVVTGGASGIGFATARALAGEGASVAIVDHRQERVDLAVDALCGLGCRAVGRAIDVRDGDAMRTAIDAFAEQFNGIDGLVASAGTSRTARAEDITDKDFDLVMDVNVKGVFAACREAAKIMIGRDGGSMVLIGSLDGFGGHSGRTQYVASKHAVMGLTRNLAVEWGRHRIRVNSVAPSFVDTPQVRAMTPPEFLDTVVCNRTPLGRLATPEDIANCALMLLSDATAFITGVTIPVDGGLTAGFVTNLNGGDYGTVAAI